MNHTHEWGQFKNLEYQLTIKENTSDLESYKKGCVTIACSNIFSLGCLFCLIFTYRMFENANEKFKKADMVTPYGTSNLIWIVLH